MLIIIGGGRKSSDIFACELGSPGLVCSKDTGWKHVLVTKVVNNTWQRIN